LFSIRQGERRRYGAKRRAPRLKREIEFFHASILGSNRTIRFEGWQSADALKAIKKGQAAFKRKHRARK
jgi:hypothetical protein